MNPKFPTSFGIYIMAELENCRAPATCKRSMSFRISTNVLRNAAKKPAPSITYNRAFHSPYAVLGDSPITAQSTSKEESISAAYEKHYDNSTEPVYNSGLRTYVVSEPDVHSRHYQVPAGAYPVSSPYINFAPTSEPDTSGLQYSSTAAEILAHGYTSATASSAVRYASAPGGGYGGLGLMDKEGATPGTGKLADRNSPPGSTKAEYSKVGIKEAWKLRI